MTTDTTQRVVIVVGGAMGIGEAIVERLARDRSTVVIADTDRNERLAQQVADNLVATGRSVSAETVDISDQGELAALAEATVEIYGRLDAVVYCAGTTPEDDDVDSLVRFSRSEIEGSGGGTIVLISDADNVIDLTREHTTNAVAVHSLAPTTFRILDAVTDLIAR